MNLKISGIIPESVVDGPGLRFVVFVQGCPHACPGCHNPHTHDFNAGKTADINTLYDKIKKNPLIKGVTLSGGEPFCQTEGLYKLCEKLKADGYHLLSYTGFTFDELIRQSETDIYTAKLLGILDVLIDGRFILAQKNLLLKFRGSENQRILDCKESWRLKKPIETEI